MDFWIWPKMTILSCRSQLIGVRDIVSRFFCLAVLPYGCLGHYLGNRLQIVFILYTHPFGGVDMP